MNTKNPKSIISVLIAVVLITICTVCDLKPVYAFMVSDQLLQEDIVDEETLTESEADAISNDQKTSDTVSDETDLGKEFDIFDYVGYPKPEWIPDTTDGSVSGNNAYKDIEYLNDHENTEDSELSSDDEEIISPDGAGAYFSERVSGPEWNSIYYFSNDNNYYRAGCAPGGAYCSTGNCTWYAYGRAYEILATCGMNRDILNYIWSGNAQNWYWQAPSWARSSQPSIGAIACWGSGAYGHVAVVERINGNGTIHLSESSYDNIYWFTEDKYPGDMGAGFQGFINIGNVPIYVPPTEKTGSIMQKGYDRVVPDGKYQIVSDIDSNYALDIQGYGAGEISDGSNAQLFRNRNVNQDVFQLTYTSGGFYEIKHVLSGKCLDVSGASIYNKANVQAWQDNDGNAQRWAIKGVGDGINYNIEAKCSGFRLDACGAVAEDRTNIWVHEANTSSAQKWRLVPYPSTNKVIENGNYHIVSRMEGGTLTVSGTSGNFRNVTVAPDKSDNSQIFTVTYESSTNSYIIKQKNTRYYLEVENCGRTRNIGVATGDANGNPDGNWKKWNIMSFGSGWYGLVSRETGEGIYYNARNKGNVTVSTSNSAYYDQYWLFYRAVESVSISQSTAALDAGNTLTLKATVSPSSAKNKEVTWSSSNTGVAAVNGSGVVTAKSAGTATITVRTLDGGYTASCKVTVKQVNVSVTDVKIADTSGTVWSGRTGILRKGKSYSLHCVITPSDATNKSVTWSSNNSSVASVTSAGVVTANSDGEVTISARTVDGNKETSCRFRVGTPPVITTASFPDAQLYSQGYSVTLQANGTAPISFSIVSGSLPDGLTLKDGRITGSPTGAGGVSTFTIKAKNEYGTSEKQFSVTVKPAKNDDPGKENVYVPKVETKTIVAGQKLNLNEDCFAGVNGRITRYTVNNKKIASVSKEMLTGLKPGTVIVTAQKTTGKNTYEDIASCSVTILNKPQLKFTIPLTYEGQLIDGSYFFITKDTNTIGAAYWESSNPKVVEVIDSSKGVLAARKQGSATISAYFGEKGKKGTLRVKAKINVKYPSFQKSRYKIQTGVNLTLAMKNVTVSMNPEWRAADSSVISVIPQTDKNGNPTGKVTVRGLSYGDTTLIATIHGREYYTEIHVSAP